MTRKLSLGPVPKSEAVKLTISISSRLRDDLDRYAELHSEFHGTPVDIAALAPLMLETFIARDKGFRALRSGRTTASSNPARKLDEPG